MTLLTPELRATLPRLRSTENVEDPVVHVKFFDPCSDWTWYVTEFDGQDLLFGVVYGLEREWGYFSLRELESVRGRLGLGIERDIYFKSCRASQLPRED